jgi:hypothetical protein
MEQNAVSSIALVYGALRAAGRSAEADSVLTEARAVLPGLALDEGVEKVLAEMDGPPAPKP